MYCLKASTRVYKTTSPEMSEQVSGSEKLYVLGSCAAENKNNHTTCTIFVDNHHYIYPFQKKKILIVFKINYLDFAKSNIINYDCTSRLIKIKKQSFM